MTKETLFADRATLKYIEELAARNAMLIEAVTAAESAFVTQVGSDYNDVVHAACCKCKQAISATSEQVAQWMREHDAVVLETAANKFMFGVAHELRSMATDLRRAAPKVTK